MGIVKRKGSSSLIILLNLYIFKVGVASGSRASHDYNDNCHGCLFCIDENIFCTQSFIPNYYFG